MPSIISSDRGPVVSRPRRLTRVWRSCWPPLMVACAPGETLAAGTVRNRSPICRVTRRHEILRSEIGHRNAHRRGAVNQRAGDKNLFRHRGRRWRLRRHLRIGSDCGGQCNKRRRPHQGRETRCSRIHVFPVAAQIARELSLRKQPLPGHQCCARGENTESV